MYKVNISLVEKDKWGRREVSNTVLTEDSDVLFRATKKEYTELGWMCVKHTQNELVLVARTPRETKILKLVGEKSYDELCKVHLKELFEGLRAVNNNQTPNEEYVKNFKVEYDNGLVWEK